MVWTAVGAGTAGWLLLTAGVGKVSDWPAFRRSLGEGYILPAQVQALLAAVVPPLEIVLGAGALMLPGPGTLIPAGLLCAAFVAYQTLVLRRGSGADCGCYGRIRRVRYGPWSIAAYTAVGAGAITSGILGGPGPVLWRTVGGAALAAVILLLLGARATEGRSGFPYAEVFYLRRRTAGDSDAAARAAVAEEFGFSGVGPTYKLVPRGRALWLVLAARWKQDGQA